ncbi:MAG: hypothetical protein E7260_12515 [Lachnospiraceae bacterium]|nr:hypothetical protein [Lachnospiraceae bacterium]
MRDFDREQRLSLSGTWQLCWQDTGAKTIETEDALWKTAVNCRVPGDVHIALTEAGVIDDPLVDVNSEKCRWMEEKEFWYKKIFVVPERFLQDKTELVFDGLDLTADIWLNGRYIGSHNNAFTSKVIDISGDVTEGENTLIVRIDDGVHGVKDKPLELMKYSWNAEQPYRAWMRKPQFVYGWDWTIWLPSCGIWKDVSICTYHAAIVRDVLVENAYESGSIATAEEITLSVTAAIEFLQPGEYVLSCEARTDGRYEESVCVAENTMGITVPHVTKKGDKRSGQGTKYTLKLRIPNPKLWWPNGAGVQYRYELVLTLRDAAGNSLQTLQKKHGIRSVALREETLDEKSKGFTFMINDTPIFAKGANHVPADCFPGRITDAKNRSLLRAAAEANMNMIRVWGGGIYESDAFMDTCDELGIMVWHDFMFACAYYPDYVPEFYEEIRTEATENIVRLRGHVSLVGWSGNNEIQEMYLAAKNSGKEFPWYGGRLYEELLPGLVKELCPDRIYRESSPFGGEEPTSYDMGDQHTWHFTHRPNWEHYLDLWRFTDFDFKFLSEFGIIGAMNLESARKCISEKALYRNSPEWIHHTNTSSEHQLLDIFVDKYFGLPKDITLQDFILKSQVLQAELMRHVYDELRSRKFRCSGVLLWTLSDSYGINNWSVIDYYLGKRPLYYYMKRFLAPVNVSFMGYEVQTFDGMKGYRDYYAGEVTPIEVLVTGDVLYELPVQTEWKVQTFDGQILLAGKATSTLPANSVVKAAEVDIKEIKDTFVPEETYLYARVIKEGEVLSENRYFFAPYGKLDLQEAKIEVNRRTRSEKETELIIKADTFVWMLHLTTPDGVLYSDNDFDLLPGEEKRITVIKESLGAFEPEFHSLNPDLTVKLICK